MIFEEMLKWAVGKEDHPFNPSKSMKKRRKQIDTQKDAQTGLISSCCKHRGSNSQGPSRTIPHKNRVRANVGSIINNNNLNNESNNGKVNSHNYKVPDQTQRLISPSSNLPSPETQNNNNIINSDSKSLLYMSLDHLPMAIVKQYERMLQDVPIKPQPRSVLKSRHVNSSTKNNSNNNETRAQKLKVKTQKQALSQQQKKSPPKSITFTEDFKDKPEPKTVCQVVIADSKDSGISIKEAFNRSLKVLVPPSSSIASNDVKNCIVKKVVGCNMGNKPLPSEAYKEKHPSIGLTSGNDKENNKTTTIPPESYYASPLLPRKQLSLVCDIAETKPSNSGTDSSKSSLSTRSRGAGRERNEAITPSHKKVPIPSISSSTTSKVEEAKTPDMRKSRIPDPHDTTDPKFLEKPITYNTQPVPKCAKKLTLKRSELKKLERLKTQTERLNRFLKKYYTDFLHNLPEEEETQCSPEEKSVKLILKRHWKATGSSSYDQPNNEGKPHYENVGLKFRHSKYPYSNLNVNNKFNRGRSSSGPPISYTNLPELSVDDYTVSWENLLNMSFSSDTTSTTGPLPIIQEDSAEFSSSTSTSESHHHHPLLSIHHHSREIEVARDMPLNILGMDESFLVSRTQIPKEDSLVHLVESSLGLTGEEQVHDRVSDNCNTRISYGDDGGGGGEEEGGGFGMKKLKDLFMEPLGELFDMPTSLAEDEGFMSPYPPEAYSPASTSSTSTFNRFSVSSSSGKGSTGDINENEVVETQGENGDKCDKDGEDEESNRSHTSTHSPCSSCEAGDDDKEEITSVEGGPKYIITDLKHENANYLEMKREEENDDHHHHNETWNSHGCVLSTPPCRTSSTHYNSSSSSHLRIPRADDGVENLVCNQMRNERENDDEEESLAYGRLALAFSTPLPKSKSIPQTCLKLKSKKWTPRKIVKKPPVNSIFSGKGEILVRTYNNADYITVHVVQARRLEPHTQSSWRLSIKVSLCPDADVTLTRSAETVLVKRDRSWTKIDQKFSFELPSVTNSKVFITAIRRAEKKSTFLGWTTLGLSTKETTQSWFKLRKRKMTTTAASYSMQSSCHSSTFTTTAATGKGNHHHHHCEQRSCSSMDSPSPQPGHPDNGSSSSSSHCDCDMDLLPKSHLQNSSTMDSGVEDCCEPPPPPAPSIDLDDKNGQKIAVRMKKAEGNGYGFSVVWVSPPRIERLEKGKTADVAGLRIGDLIIGVNGEDVTSAPNTTIYTKMKSTGNELGLEVWRTTPPIQSRSSHHHHYHAQPISETVPPQAKLSTVPPTTSDTPTARAPSNINESRKAPPRNSQPVPQMQGHAQQQPQQPAKVNPPNNNNNNNNNTTPPMAVANTSMPNQNIITTPSTSSISANRLQAPLPPASILKPVATTTAIQEVSCTQTAHVHTNSNQQPQQPQNGTSSWRIKFNIELLNNEDECLKQFFICELKFFKKVVAALDRYLIPAQSNRLLSPNEINLIFANVIKVITVTKRILNCVANGSSNTGWKFGEVLLSTHTDHSSEVVSAYTEYAKTLGYSSTILSGKMSLQEFARFVLETPVPKGHLDMTSLLFAPLEHLRNICEILEEISSHNDKWMQLFTCLKDCYADIVCDTDFMEPISHITMKKNPLLSVRDLEKRVVSTSCQPVKVCEKGRRWLFGSRLFKKESDGSWSPVWAFLFTDIIVLTSHTTRDRVFFVKESPIRLDDVVTAHFNLPKKHENEFRLLFEPEPVHQSRLDKLLPLHKKKPNQVVLRTPNIQLKSMWKLLLQRQIIAINTRLAKSASSNFSISEFCERFPITPQCEDEDMFHPKSQKNSSINSSSTEVTKAPCQQQSTNAVGRSLSVIKEEKFSPQLQSKPTPQIKQYAPDGLSSMSKELLKSRVSRNVLERKEKVEPTAEDVKVNGNSTKHDTTDTLVISSKPQNQEPNVNPPLNQIMKTSNVSEMVIDSVNKANLTSVSDTCMYHKSTEICSTARDSFVSTSLPEESQQCPKVASNCTTNNNNNEITDFNKRNEKVADERCPCTTGDKASTVNNDRQATPKSNITLPDKSEKSHGESNVPQSPASQDKPVAKPRRFIPQSSEELWSKDMQSEEDGSETGSQTSLPRQDDKYIRNVSSALSVHASPSPSRLSHNRVESLKFESVGTSVAKPPKPSPRIMTNATLKSRQQELLAQREGQTIITMVEQPSSSSSNGTDCILISQRIEPASHEVDTRDASSSPILPPRCQSENGFVKPKSVHTDSPLLTGFGAGNARRRILYDYKVQKDYPELFGISPRDRRSYIKHIAEKPPKDEKPLVAPYYFSPMATPKFPKNVGTAPSKNDAEIPMRRGSGGLGAPIKKGSYPPSTKGQSDSGKSDMKQPVAKNGSVKVPESSHVNSDVSIRQIAQGMLRQVHPEEVTDDSESDESSDECRKVTAEVHRQRSPEESSNDSGISDEATEKSKPRPNERFQSNLAVNSTEVNSSSKLSSHCDKTQNLPKTAHACLSTPKQNESTKIDHVCFQGEEEIGVASMVVLNKADKCTETDADLFYFHQHASTFTTAPEYKSMRDLMAERRQAFFGSQSSAQQTNTSFHSPQYTRSRIESPLRVKIVDGGTLQTTTKETCKNSAKTPPSERVQLAKFPEKEKTPSVENVESSDDSTSSDVASASPAPENATTDPSWSSSSSSVGGYTSSKEEGSTSVTSASYATSIYNSNYVPLKSMSSDSSHPSSTSSLTKILMSDFTKSIPTTSFCNFPSSSQQAQDDSENHKSNGPEIVVTQESSPDTPTIRNSCDVSDGEEDGESIFLCEGGKRIGGEKKGFLRVESNDSTVENFGDEDDYNLDDEEELSQCSGATINRYGTYESLEKIENDDPPGALPDPTNRTTTMTRSKARFTFDDEDDSDDDEDLFEEDFESDFNFRFPSQIQDNTYSVSRLGPLPPLLEEDYEDDYDDQAGSSENCDPGPSTSSSSTLANGSSLRSRHAAGLRNNGFLLARLATMYTQSSISPLKILRDLWLKKRYRQSDDWLYKE